MKYLFIFLIAIYQIFISLLLKAVLGSTAMCRYSPSCSEYSKRVILKYGILRGGYLSLIRILSCQPFKLKTQISKLKAIA